MCVLMFVCVCVNMQMQQKGDQHLGGRDDEGGGVGVETKYTLCCSPGMRCLLETASIWCILVSEPNVVFICVCCCFGLCREVSVMIKTLPVTAAHEISLLFISFQPFQA